MIPFRLIVVGSGAVSPPAEGERLTLVAGNPTRLMLWTAKCPVLGRVPAQRAPVIAAGGSEPRARSTPFVVGRSGRGTALVRPQPPRRPGPAGGDAA